MDKETLLSKFKPSMGEPNATSQIYESIGISVRTLESYAEAILSSIKDDENVTDDFIKSHVDILKAMGGQLRHEKAEFIKGYKPQQTPPPNNQTPPNITENPEISALKQSVEELKGLLNGEKKQKELEALRQEVKSKAKSLKVMNQALWDDVVNTTEIKDGMDSATFEGSVKSAYESKLKSYFGDGAQPYGGTSSGGSGTEEKYKDKREAFREKMRAMGKLPKKTN